MVAVSAKDGHGIDELRAHLLNTLRGEEDPREHPSISNVRHRDLLGASREALMAARQLAVVSGTPEELVLSELHDALDRFGEILGRRTTDDVLKHIFERFCIGK